MAVNGEKEKPHAIIHGLVYRRDNWECQMPECICPDGRKIDALLTVRLGDLLPELGKLGLTGD